uniref:Aminopeptidase YwaD n=1 Tax=uncultured Thiotrichaceae bacterium TaxID=298394 RepID=A0A6S6UL82_9GAMM|nr:MAG: Aminopeptidase YwaD [uncultured Thiotrichaceae bacterium]
MLKKIMKTLLIYGSALLFVLFSIWFAVTQPVWVNDQKTAQPDIDPATLRSHVVMLSETLPPRTGTETDLRPTINWLEGQLSQYGELQRQTYEAVGQQFHNLILEFGPDTGKTLVIGAHYDTHAGLPGADDNASGVAGLIELARLLSTTDLQRRVTLVAYTLEEYVFYATPFMGSYVHAKMLKDKNIDVELMISLEMIGYFNDEPDSQLFPVSWLKHFYSDRGDFIAVIGNMSNIPAVRTVKSSFLRSAGEKLPVYSLNAPMLLVPGIDSSDHRNYWIMDYPAVMITDTAYNRNLAYHTPQDTADRLDYDKMADVVKATYQLVLDMNHP